MLLPVSVTAVRDMEEILVKPVSQMSLHVLYFIGSSLPLVSRKRRLNGPIFWMNPQNPRHPFNRFGTKKTSTIESFKLPCFQWVSERFLIETT